MTPEERVWLVDRTYTDKGLVTLVYATPDGGRAITMQRSATMLANTDVTAAERVATDELAAVDDDTTRERYAAEVGRMRERHEPDDEV